MNRILIIGGGASGMAAAIWTVWIASAKKFLPPETADAI